MWNRRIPIVVSSLRYFGRRRIADDEIDDFVSSKIADPVTSGNSTPEESWDKDADLEIQESDSQGKTELTPNFPKCDTVEWNSLKSAGLGDLTTPPIHSVRKELMSHVPSETVVMKYGYVRFIFSFHLQVASKVLDALNNIIEHGGVVSSTTLNSIMIQDMELSEDGRDINVRYTILRDNVHSTNRKMASLLDDSDIDSLFVDFSTFRLLHFS